MRKPQQPSLAKLTRPRLHGVVPRERLFRQLDDARERPAVWIIGPPGAGKTTLAASYLDAREIPGIWYQLDSGDADAAGVFYYLGQAAEPYRDNRAALPVLTPEYLPDLEGFTRLYLRDLFARLPAASAVVLDNYQEVPADAPFHALVAAAAEEVPEGVTLFALSRAEAPPSWSRLLASDKLRVIDWDDLRLTLEETRAISSAKATVTEEDVRRLHGNFLPGDSEESWTVKPRLRLRGMFSRMIEAVGERWELAGEWDKAVKCYQRGLEADDLVEEFYVGLMRCYKALNRPAEGIAVFRRLRQTLSVVLGVAPSPSAEVLVKQLRDAAQIRVPSG